MHFGDYVVHFSLIFQSDVVEILGLDCLKSFLISVGRFFRSEQYPLTLTLAPLHTRMEISCTLIFHVPLGM